jgi:hypothetical protein
MWRFQSRPDCDNCGETFRCSAYCRDASDDSTNNGRANDWGGERIACCRRLWRASSGRRNRRPPADSGSL